MWCLIEVNYYHIHFKTLGITVNCKQMSVWQSLRCILQCSNLAGKTAELLYGSENEFVLSSEAKDAWDWGM